MSKSGMPTSTIVAEPTTLEINPPLSVPDPSPNVSMSDPEFEKLTTAEKLNNRKYRELIYQTYPNEMTCACNPEVSRSNSDRNDQSEVRKSLSNLLGCRSGCKRACCSSVRQPGIASFEEDNANKNDKVPLAPFMPTYCVGRTRGGECDKDERNRKAHNGDYCAVKNRLRGGGGGGGFGEGGDGRGEGGMYPQSREVNRTMLRSFDDAWNGRKGCVVDSGRFKGGCGGGTDYEYVERYPANRSLVAATRTSCCTEENLSRGYPSTRHVEQAQDSHLDTSHLRALPNGRASSLKPLGSVAAGCCCSGKETLARSARERGNGESCVRSTPCPGVDCLIKTFQETQQFVESLGRVPGLAGLGLMDPAESPYFGRERPKNSNSEVMKPVATSRNHPNPQCLAACNPHIPKSAVADPYYAATPFTIAVPGRGGIVREAVPSTPGSGSRYPSGKARKRDDRDKSKEVDGDSVQPELDTSPCGQFRCKSRRRKIGALHASSAVEFSEDAARKSSGQASMSGGRTSRTMNKVKGGSSRTRSGHRSSDPGPGGDRTWKTKSAGKSTKRTMRFVYSVGETYTGFTRAHKDCVKERRRVPWNMGWLWNLNQPIGRLKPRVGWKPGAIARHVSEILREAKANYFLDCKSSKPGTRSSVSSRPRSAPSRGKRSKVHGDRRSVKRMQMNKTEEEEEAAEPPPTLYIHRKDGTYYVTMYPIKQDTLDIPKLEEPMKPLQFKITKNKDTEGSAATSSTASDMEIEFSPPAAVNRYRKKPNVVHVDTQVKQQEIIEASKNEDAKKKEKKKGKKEKN